MTLSFILHVPPFLKSIHLGLSRAAGKIEIRQLTPDRRFTGAGPETDGSREGENGGGVGRFIIARGAQRGINALK